MKILYLRLKKYKSNSESGLSTSFYFFTSETEDKSSLFHTRMFCLENNKVFEDSATGSAASCFVGYLLKNKTSEIKGVLEQGYEMNRPSKLYIYGNKKDSAYSIHIGGACQLVSRGVWYHKYV